MSDLWTENERLKKRVHELEKKLADAEVEIVGLTERVEESEETVLRYQGFC